jgi:hypothetical protein
MFMLTIIVIVIGTAYYATLKAEENTSSFPHYNLYNYS